MADINLQHRFKEDQTLSFDLNYLWYHDNNPTDYVNEYYDAQGDYLFSELTKSTKLTPIHFWVGTADYAMRLGKKWNMQSGLKFTLSRFTNDVGVERYLQNNWVKDTELTGKYKLKEDIGAAYLSFNGDPSEKTSIKLGLRYEYTTSNLGTVAIPNIVDRKYGRLFPSFFISHKLNDDNSMNFSYSRRINRPTFNEMAPFVIFMDPYTFFAGNAAIQPSITNTLKADYLLKNFVFSLSYAMEAGTISRFQVDVDVANNKQYFRAQNLDKTNSLTASFSLPFNFTKWWSMQANIIGTWEKISASYKNDPVNIDIASFNAFASQTFKLPKNYTLELSGFYQSPGLFGIARFEGLGRMDFGAQKKIGTKGGSLRFSITDVFQSMLIKISSDMKDQGFYTNSTIRFNYRTFRLTWTCPFGNKELKGKRNRATGSEEERSRVSQQ